jgi:septum formation protein
VDLTFFYKLFVISSIYSQLTVLLMTAQIILASTSPRRRELLAQIGVRYQVYSVSIDESPLINESPLHYVQRIAENKSAAALEQLTPPLPILSADTAVVLNNTIMGKPKNYADAYSMLQQLSGQTHQVYSAISLRGKQNHSLVNISEVQFKTLMDSEIMAYCQTNEPWDKAGSYAIQGLAALFIKQIRGSFSAVMGLPLFETAQLLQREGIELLSDSKTIT